MFNTKKDVDQHVRSALTKLKSENEKKLRGFPIAKLYYKVNEYETARHYISMFLSVKEDCAPAHRLLGQCHQKLKKPQKALESFQRSLQLDPKQPDLLIEVCKLLLNNDDNNSINMSQAKYWCDLAESQKVQHEIITDLRSKLLKLNNMDVKQIEEILLKEITLKPNDPNLKIRLVKHYIEQNKITSAFKYVYDQELKYHDLFINCFGWYNIIWLTLNKYKQQSNTNKNWEFWLLLIICLERQVEISFTIANGSLTETANLLFNFDQYMYEAAKYTTQLFPEKEFSERFIDHFRGQICLYAAALIFKREQKDNKNQWKESIKTSLPLLLLAFQCGTLDIQKSWVKHCDDKIKQLIQLWNREGAFRCSQAGRTLLSCIRDNTKENTSVSLQVHQVITEKVYWSNSNDLLSHIRSYCSDLSWRNKIYRILFANSDQISKTSTSFLINSQSLSEPIYELPSYSDIETYEEIAQYLRPQSLKHMVYLCLGIENLSNVRCKYFNGLNFSVQNLNFCGSESLNQLDIETFLYATTIQAKRLLEIERMHCENYNSVNIGKPLVLPFVNMTEHLCTEEQNNWWTYAYQVYKNLINGENLGEIRAVLQYGIEAVRGINGPKMDLMIILKLGKIFMNRSQDTIKSGEKNYLEHRTEILYKHALSVYKLHIKSVLEPFRKLFQYSNPNSSNIENEMIELAEEAVTYLAARYFKKAEYEECIEEFSGIQIPFATYFQAEAYRKLDESNKTPKKTKRFYLDKARECLNQTLNLLSFPNISSNHPLNSIVNSEIKRLQFIRQLSNENFDNGQFHGDNDRDFYSSVDDHHSSYYGGGMNRSRSESSTIPKLIELENLVKQVATTLMFVKEELVDMIKPELKNTRKELIEFKGGIKTELNELKSGIKTELNELRDKLTIIEENMKKKSQTPSRDDTSNVLDDLYLIGDELQNQVYSNQANLYSGYVQQLQPQQRIHTPSALPASHHPVIPPPSTHHPQSASPWYSGDYFTQPQYLNPGSVYPPTVTDRQHFSFNQRLSFPDTTNATLNFNMPPPQPSSIPVQHHQVSASLQMPDNRGHITSFMANNQQQPQQPTTNTQTLTNKTTPQPLPTVKSSPALWNRVLNNAPVEKGPPVNVVITSSDPLPTTNAGMFSQPTLSVTIPPQHIKSNFTPNENNIGLSNQQMGSNTSFPIMSQSFPTIPAVKTSTSQISTSEIESNLSSNYSEYPSSVSIVTRSSESNDNNEILNESDNNNAEAEYDPRPDFKPIIPLPDEVEVKTGEEDEEVLFCSRAKLFRHVEKEWRERGTGDIKILKSKKDGRIRILMRRDQTHKVCANHFITGEMDIVQRKNEDKSYIWAAKDFADEEEKSETLCVRFKYVEVAKEFHDAFIKARDEVKNSNLNTTGDTENLLTQKMVTLSNPVTKSNIFNFNNTTSSTNAAIEIGGSSCPIPKSIFSSASENKAVGKDKAEVTSNKSPFADFTFDNKTVSTASISTANTPFANLFTNFTDKSQLSANDAQSKTLNTFPSITKAINAVSTTQFVNLNSATNNEDNINQLNKSNTGEDDDFVPTAEFKPVIPLPDLVEVQTGEENELVLFEHRAKLFRYDKNLSQWKERGLGNIKLLAEKNNLNCVRLVMRREQVLKVCINLRLTKTMVFKSSPKSETSLQFGGKDYSDDETEGKIELFMIRFKTAEIRKNFHEAILKAQQNMTEINETDKKIVTKTTTSAPHTNTQLTVTSNKDQNKSVVVEKNIQGFGDQFKPKAGSWSCNACYTSNTSETLYCAACNSPKDDTILKKNLQGFGDQFKPKAGSWSCNACYTSNTSETLYCAACNSPKDDTILKKNLQGFGDQFKPKAGSWSCNACYTSNTSDALYCVACETPKDDTVPKKPSKNIFDISSKADNNTAATTTFTFGFGSGINKPGISIATTETTSNASISTTSAINSGTSIGFGDKFKPKMGSWSCKACYLSNESNVLYCIACSTPKDDTVPKKDTMSLQQSKNVLGTTFFGFGQNSTPVDLTKQQPFKFSFGNNSKTETAPDVCDVAEKSKTNIFSFDTKKPVTATENDSTATVAMSTFNTFSFATTPFGSSNNNNNAAKALATPVNSIFDNKTTASDSTNPEQISKPAFSFSMPINNAAIIKSTASNDNSNEYKLEKKEFNFVLKPKSPGKTKSPLKNNTSGVEDESDNENVEEENNAYFTPVIPLPDKIEVKTGEENEEILYAHRAKLYRFSNSEWKERGIGDVKILRHRETKKLRVVMRREQVLKICLNHVLTEDVEYMSKDDKSWHFVVKDFSEGELELTQFCLRFKTKEIAGEFMKAVKNALNNINTNEISNEKPEDTNNENKDKDNNESETIEGNEQDETNRKLAEKLQLPQDFFEKLDGHEDCKGCRGCDPDKFIFPTYNDETKTPEDEEKHPLPLDMSGMDFNKKSNTGNNSILRQSALVQTKLQTEAHKDENKSIFSGAFDKSKSTNVFNLGDNINFFQSSTFFSTPVEGQKSIFGGNSYNASSTEKVPETASSTTNIFSSNFTNNLPQQPNFIFGNSQFSFNNSGSNSNSVFGKIFGTPESIEKKDEKTENKTAAKVTEAETTNLFKDPGISFSDLAAKSASNKISNVSQESPAGGFFGLTQNDAFKNFLNPKSMDNKNSSNGGDNVVHSNSNDTNDDANYDPHYDPIIELPDEIKVVTGEENEEKVFGERATVFRYDSETKQWKERGVGELKILYHPTKGTYRLILRREQIHKLVLNHAITYDFSMKPMNNSGKAYCWAAQNYVEDSAALEKLACRFKQAEIGQRFEAQINKCIELLKKRADLELEPEED